MFFGINGKEYHYISDGIIQENLHLILESLDLIENRFSRIASPDDLVGSEYGVLVLDSIAMRLQVVGELLKKINKIENSLLWNYPQVAWSNIMKLRDIVSHHYDKIDHEIIFDICQNHLQEFKTTISEIIEEQKPQDTSCGSKS